MATQLQMNQNLNYTLWHQESHLHSLDTTHAVNSKYKYNLEHDNIKI